MSRFPKFIIVFVIPLAIIGAGAGAAVKLAKSRAAPERTAQVDRGTLVTTEVVERGLQSVEVEAKGTIRAAQRLSVQTQLNGEITSINDKLVPGGLIKKGEVLLRIQGRDFRIAVDQRETSVAQAEANLRIEEGQQRVAKKEWELFKDQVEGSGDDPSLALRAPQKRVAEVSLDAAKSRLDQAKLNLSRTSVRAPFNLMVESENVEVGQILRPGAPAATVVGTDLFWVQVSVPIDRLDFINIPGVNAKEGSAVTVIQTIGHQEIKRAGRVVRLLGELDPIGRMARVLVEIDDPLNLAVPEGDPRGLPFLLGAFVSVVFDGAQQMEVAEIPRSALHEGDKVYVYNDGKLDIRNVGVVWRRVDSVLISDGLGASDELITSRVSTPLPGMKLRKASEAK